MAEELGTGYIIISPSTKGLGKAIEGQIDQSTATATRKSGRTIVSNLGTAFKKVGQVGLGAITAFGGGLAALAAKGGFDRALNIERAQTKLKALGHDAKSVDGIMDDALASVKGTAFGLGDAASVAAGLVASGVKQGEQLKGVLTTVGDTAQVAGVEFSQMGTIFGKVAATGKLQGDEMLQLMEAGIPVLQYLAEHYKVTAAEAQKMVSDGKVSFADFEAAMKEHLGGAAKSAGDSFDGMFANLKAAFSRAGEKFATPLIGAMTELGNKAIPVVDQLANGIVALADKFGQHLDKAVDMAGQWLDTFSGKLDSGQTSVTGMLHQLGLLAGGFGALTLVGGNVDGILGVFDQLGGAIESGGKTIGRGASGMVSGIKKVFDGAKGAAKDGWAAIQLVAEGLDLKKTATTKLAGLAFTFENNPVGSAMVTFAGTVKDKAGRLSDAVGGALGKTKDWAKSGLSGVAAAFGNNPVIASIGGFAHKVSGKISGPLHVITDVFGTWASGIGSKLGAGFQTVFGKVGTLVGGFFKPGNFMKFIGVGGIIAALLAGLGSLDTAMLGQIQSMIDKAASEGPALISKFAQSITSRLPQLIETGGQMVRQIIDAVTLNLPGLVSLGASIVFQLLQGLGQQLPTLIPSAVQMVSTLLQALITQMPHILQGGMQLLQGLVTGIINALPTLIEMIPTLITTFINGVITSLPMILETGTQLLTALVNGIVACIPQLVAMLPQIIETTVTTLLNNLPAILEAGMQLLMALINGLVQAIPQLIAMLPQIIASIVNTLASNMPAIINAGVQILIALITGLIQAIPQLIGAIPQIIGAVKDAFGNVDWGSIGMNIITGIKDGLVGAAGQLWDAAKNVAKNAWDGVKNFLGINSPSRLFRDTVGKQIAAGMVVGMQRSEGDVAAAGMGLAKASLPNMDAILDQAASTMAYGMRKQTDQTYARNGSAKSGTTSYGGDTNNRTYNIYANDPDLVVAKIDARETRARAGWGGE